MNSDKEEAHEEEYTSGVEVGVGIVGQWMHEREMAVQQMNGEKLLISAGE